MKFLKFLVVLLTIFATSTFAYGYLYEKEVIEKIEPFIDKRNEVNQSNVDGQVDDEIKKK